MRVAIDLEAYARRIGYLQPLTPDLATVQGIVRAHVAAIAFENLDPLMGRTLDLDPLALEDKLVHAGRGGYCFEHNLLMAEVLRAMRAAGDRPDRPRHCGIVRPMRPRRRRTCCCW